MSRGREKKLYHRQKCNLKQHITEISAINTYILLTELNAVTS